MNESEFFVQLNSPKISAHLCLMNMIKRGLAAQSKCHIGISPSGQKMGHWDLSQSHVQDVYGIDPNVKKRGVWD